MASRMASKTQFVDDTGIRIIYRSIHIIPIAAPPPKPRAVPVEVASPKLLDPNRAVLVRHLPFNRPVVPVEGFGDLVKCAHMRGCFACSRMGAQIPAAVIVCPLILPFICIPLSSRSSHKRASRAPSSKGSLGVYRAENRSAEHGYVTVHESEVWELWSNMRGSAQKYHRCF
jgi:hypothetical protein